MAGLMSGSCFEGRLSTLQRLGGDLFGRTLRVWLGLPRRHEGAQLVRRVEPWILALADIGDDGRIAYAVAAKRRLRHPRANEERFDLLEQFFSRCHEVTIVGFCLVGNAPRTYP